MLAAMWSSKSVSASPSASRKTLSSLRVTRLIEEINPLASGNSTAVDVTMAPVGTWLVETTAIVRSGRA